MDIQIFADLFAQGLTPIPVKWDEKTKQATIHPEHGNIHTLQDVTTWLDKMNGANGIALKLHPPFGMVDIDQKNSKRKNIFKDWLHIVESTDSEVLRKLCIEETRNAGHHIYIKYPGLSHKIPIARSDGKEVISVYTGSLLSYCYPTPGYTLIHNEFCDIQELTQIEFDLLVSASAYFNEDTEFTPGASTIQLIDYPTEYENTALQFDSQCTDKMFEQILNSIDLFEVKGKQYKAAKYIPYLRKGSSANYSAKAYYSSKRLLIFSASMTGFPTWHDCNSEGDNRWSLSPTKILYYKNKRDWGKTIAELTQLSKENDIEIILQKPVTKQPISDRLKFPYDIFPEKIQQYIFAQSIQHEYLAGAVLGAVSAAIGNTTYLEAMPGYNAKAILYIAIVAPPGAAKTPAVKKAFLPLEEYDQDNYITYKQQEQEYQHLLAEYERDKKNTEKPNRPIYPQVLIKDSTIEMVSDILNNNPFGCCILADELSGFLNRMNQYKAGDEEQKWLELWSGSNILNQRVGTGIKKVMDPFCSIIGGIQPGVLESLSKDDRQHNGFYHRFLFVYPDQQPKPEWKQIQIPMAITAAFRSLFIMLIAQRNNSRVVYELSPDANRLYKEWFDYKNLKYNKAQSDNIKGIIAKYQDYCLRFALICQVLDDGPYRPGLVMPESMERAIRLTEYFLGNMHKASKILTPETPLDKLQDNYKRLYDALPQSFSTKTLQQLAVTFDIKDGAAKMFLTRQTAKLFEKTDRNTYEKMF